MFTTAKPAQVEVEVSVDPTSISATSEVDQAVTIASATPDMLFVCNWPTLESGLGITAVRCDAAGTVKIRIRNFTAGAIDPAAKQVKILGF